MLATFMLVSGAFNILSLKFEDTTKVDGLQNGTWDGYQQNHYYSHPVIQALGMFTGELLCLVMLAIYNTFIAIRDRHLTNRTGHSSTNDSGNNSGLVNNNDPNNNNSNNLTQNNSRTNPGYSADEANQNANNHANFNQGQGEPDTTDSDHAVAQEQPANDEELLIPNENDEYDTSSVYIRTLKRLCTRIWFLVPAMFDCMATMFVYHGITLTSASSAQMLRGSVTVFRYLNATFIFKYGNSELNTQRNRIYGVLLVILGISIICYTDHNFYSDPALEKTHPELFYSYKNVLKGDLIIVVAQIFICIQMYIEEFSNIVPSDVSSVEAVGWEGLWGFTLLLILIWPLSQIKFSWYEYLNIGQYTPKQTFEDVSDCLAQLKNSPKIVSLTIGQIISVCIFNITGINYVQQPDLDAKFRMLLDVLRTVVIWTCGIYYNTQLFIPWQSVGFFLQIVGLCWFNRILLPECLRSMNRYEDERYEEGSQILLCRQEQA